MGPEALLAPHIVDAHGVAAEYRDDSSSLEHDADRRAGSRKWHVITLLDLNMSTMIFSQYASTLPTMEVARFCSTRTPSTPRLKSQFHLPS